METILNRYAERLFEFPGVDPLDDVSAAKAIRDPIEEMGAKIKEDALELIVQRTDRYPYFLQEWGAHAWNTAAASPIELEDVESASGAAVAALDASFFRVRFDRLTPREQEYLRGMAALGPGPHRSGDIAAELGIAVTTAGPLRTGLIRKGMLWSPAHGDTAFTVPLFDEYMIRVMPEWKSRGG